MGSDDGDDDTYYVAGTRASSSGGKTVHADEDCQYLRMANTVYEKSAAVIPDWYDRCARCWGDG